MAEEKTAQQVAEPDKTPRLRLMFEELSAQKAKILETLAPARAGYERLVNDPRLIECRKQIKEGNALLAPIEQELAALARALGARGIKAEQGVYASEEK